ncbi:hypothetical protein OEW28_02365 [Defluviimonas sp. WL0002]|uniref:Uncharacterized protein n=1 Tax=Albidovulum marisflavi TaxID=2984159 RepID=A0ABT2Z8Q9_9RHOB|nr:hypothetical protein [Defluviimonas sp. WL0002]MCV2867467.1 hypothetical protein [Defluviimonas sp. WL0002]
MKMIALSAAVLCIAASGAMAKGHDQGNTAVPGAEDVGSGTVANAQALGGAKGNRPNDKGPSAANLAAEIAGR